MVKIPQLAEARGWENAIDLDILALMTTSQQDAWSSYISNVAAGGAPDAYIHMQYTLADQDTKSYLASLVKEGLSWAPAISPIVVIVVSPSSSSSRPSQEKQSKYHKPLTTEVV